jgi:hypothetical protein
MKQISGDSRKSQLLREYFHNAALIALFKELTVEAGVTRRKIATEGSPARATRLHPAPVR